MSAEPDWRTLLGPWADRPAQDFIAMLRECADAAREAADAAELVEAQLAALLTSAE